MKTTRTLYAERLAAEGVRARRGSRRRCGTSSQARWRTPIRRRKSYKPNKADWLEGHWSGFQPPERRGRAHGGSRPPFAGATLKQIGARAARVPAGFDLNPKIARQLEAKQAMIETGEGIDWATGEALAFGSLLLEGQPRAAVRRGQPARHVQPAPRRADRPDQPERIRAAEQHRARTRRRSRSTTRCCRKPACSASNTATRWPIRARWCCGRRSSATSPTARR